MSPNRKGNSNLRTQITQKELIRRQSVFAIESNLDRMAAVVIEDPPIKDVIKLESVSSLSDSSEPDSSRNDSLHHKDEFVSVVAKSTNITPKVSEVRHHEIEEL